jgi:two-component system, NarL family, sensor kinase
MPDDKELQFFIYTALTVFLLLVGFIVLFIRYYYRKQLANAREKQTMAATFQEELLQSQIEIQEQTLRNISEEIHDNIGQTLSLAKLQLNTINVDERSVEKLTGSKALVSRAIQDLRQLSKNIHTESVLGSGLVKAIAGQLELIERTGICKTELTVSGTPSNINPQVELILFRIVQEALNNSLKHSAAFSINVLIKSIENQLYISVSDNGKGFDPRKNGNSGSGLRNMRNRTKLIGGELNITSGTPGTTITVTINNE